MVGEAGSRDTDTTRQWRAITHLILTVNGRQKIGNKSMRTFSSTALANGFCTTSDSNIIREPESGVARLCASHVSDRPSAADDQLRVSEDSRRSTG
jgi:hypothetical protein